MWLGSWQLCSHKTQPYGLLKKKKKSIVAFAVTRPSLQGCSNTGYNTLLMVLMWASVIWQLLATSYSLGANTNLSSSPYGYQGEKTPYRETPAILLCNGFTFKDKWYLQLAENLKILFWKAFKKKQKTTRSLSQTLHWFMRVYSHVPIKTI